MSIEEYISEHTSPENEALEAISRDTYLHVLNAHMVSGQVQGRLLSMISHMIRPKMVLELGTFTGYSALCLAEGLAQGGKVITIEHNDELEERIRRNLARSPLGDKVELIIGDAMEVLDRSLRSLTEHRPFASLTDRAQTELHRAQNTDLFTERFDLVFIDADKRQYCEYLDAVYDLVADGGFIIADNTLWDGHVIDEAYDKDKQTLGLRAFNDKIAHDERFEQVIVPVRDGMTIIRKVRAKS